MRALLTEALHRVVDAAYEKRSIALSSNLHPAAHTASNTSGSQAGGPLP